MHENVQDRIEKIREAARALGWAIGVHGSLKRDIDLIAVPWTADAAKWDDFLSAMRKLIGMELGNFEEKPHGRLAFLIADPKGTCVNHSPEQKARWIPPAVDLSIVDPRMSAKP